MRASRLRIRALIPHPSDPCLVLVPLTKGMFATIDAAYAREIGQFNWQAYTSGKTPYACRHVIGGSSISLHVEIAKLAGIVTLNLIDHRNGNGLDCRSQNLRAATKSENKMNSALPSNNTSGHKGVTRHKRAGKWQAQISVGGKDIYLGTFREKQEAVNAVVAARLSLHGEFARQ